MNKPKSLQDAVNKGPITQQQANEFRRLVESGDIIELLMTTEMTIADLKEEEAEVATIHQALDKFDTLPCVNRATEWDDPPGYNGKWVTAVCRAAENVKFAMIKIASTTAGQSILARLRKLEALAKVERESWNDYRCCNAEDCAACKLDCDSKKIGIALAELDGDSHD